VKIINNCTLKYKPDHIYVTKKILEKVPDKYLVGLEEINFYDDERDPIVKYVKGMTLSNPSRIDVFMGGLVSAQKYSLVHFNFVINPTIVDHIVQYLQPKSNDKDILSYRSGRYDPNWLCLGIWSPLLIPMNLGRFLYNKVAPFRLFIDAKIRQFVDKHTKNTTQQRH
jgi:hypothetical protein